VSVVLAEAKRRAAKAGAPRLEAAVPEPLVRKLDYVLADKLPPDDETFDDELIEGVLGRIAMAVLYGDSNSGKTFIAIDMAAAICRECRWLDRHNVANGLVVYLATEAAASVRLRLKAYQRQHGVRVPGFVIVQAPINLFDGDADTVAVIALVAEIEALDGEKSYSSSATPWRESSAPAPTRTVAKTWAWCCATPT
jgi:putative DNA primase/helicase